jgi:hypothetical protein
MFSGPNVDLYCAATRSTRARLAVLGQIEDALAGTAKECVNLERSSVEKAP